MHAVAMRQKVAPAQRDLAWIADLELGVGGWGGVRDSARVLGENLVKRWMLLHKFEEGLWAVDVVLIYRPFKVVWPQRK